MRLGIVEKDTGHFRLLHRKKLNKASAMHTKAAEPDSEDSGGRGLTSNMGPGGSPGQDQGKDPRKGRAWGQHPGGAQDKWKGGAHMNLSKVHQQPEEP